jgi:ferredoxin
MIDRPREVADLCDQMAQRYATGSTHAVFAVQGSIPMPHIAVEGYSGFDVPAGTRLVNALEANGVDILHRCGGYARCTICRVVFLAPKTEQILRQSTTSSICPEILGQARLACQITADHDMIIRPLLTLRGSGLSDPGPEPKETIHTCAAVDHSERAH